MDTTNTGSSATSRIPILTGLDNYFQWRNAVEDGALVYGALHALTEEPKERPVRLGWLKGSTSLIYCLSIPRGV